MRIVRASARTTYGRLRCEDTADSIYNHGINHAGKREFTGNWILPDTDTPDAIYDAAYCSSSLVGAARALRAARSCVVVALTSS